MMKAIVQCFALAAIFLVQNTSGQDFRVYTRIYSASDSPNSAAAVQADQIPVGKSLMLIHAGKIYDYIEPSQEITIFEPALKRFIVISKQHQLRSELTQEEIRHFLSLAHGEAQKEISVLAGDPDPRKKKMYDFLRFQLQPEFETNVDHEHSRVTMESDLFHYSVQTRTPASQEIATKYLHVADWIAQLNSVLHPGSFLPAARMQLNQELREQGQIPMSVELTVDLDPQIHLIANHEWTWNLKETDRQMIDEWESHVQNPAIRNLPFRKFQQERLKLVALKRR